MPRISGDRGSAALPPFTSSERLLEQNWRRRGSTIRIRAYLSHQTAAGPRLRWDTTAGLFPTALGLVGGAGWFAFLWAISAVLKPRALLVAENLCLPQQLLVLQHRYPQPRLRNVDEQYWICASRWFAG